MTDYDKIKAQIKFITGKQAITCPSCEKGANAYVSRKQKTGPRSFRFVRTACRHCGTSYTFNWYDVYATSFKEK